MRHSACELCELLRKVSSQEVSVRRTAAMVQKPGNRPDATRLHGADAAVCTIPRAGANVPIPEHAKAKCVDAERGDRLKV